MEEDWSWWCNIDWRSIASKSYIDFVGVSEIRWFVVDGFTLPSGSIAIILVLKVRSQLEKHWKLITLWLRCSKLIILDLIYLPLSLFANYIGDEGATAIGESLKVNSTLTSLKSVKLIAWFASFTHFYQFKLHRYWSWRCSIDRRSFESQSYFDYTGVSDSFVYMMVRFPLILTTSISLNNNDIGDEGAAWIGEALEVNQTLTSLE